MSKQLGEFLQEQQEPFTLELYLLERGHFRSNTCSSDGDFRCFSVNSTKFLKRSASCGAKKRRKVIPSCSKIVKAVLNKFVTISHDQKIKNLEEHRNATNADGDNFSSASSTTVFNSCSDISDAEEEDNVSQNCDTSPQASDGNFLHEKQVFEDRTARLEFLEENNKQLSPVSVLEETESSDEDTPDNKTQECPKAKKQEESSSKSGETSHESQYIINKKAIQQSRQLLFDCVKEVVENQRRKKSKEEEFEGILGSEELWELVLENIWLWSQESINETKINQLMYFDMLNSYERSKGVEEMREVGTEIGDLIFHDISNEIVIDMFNCSSSR